ncbi:MAG: hypothetical protein IT423_14920, partial [Pirellulaceae bacterium]|nr:hypothetical protein [Pirellulaceae bacterium]
MSRIVLVMAALLQPAWGQEPVENVAAKPGEQPVEQRAAFIIEVPLPLMGSRDEAIKKQIEQVATRTRADGQRPIVVLHFTTKAAAASKDSMGAGNQPGASSKGSQFERCLSLARDLTSPTAAKVRLIAYLTEPVEGHAVLPVLACEDIVVSSEAELGRAAIDESMVDDTIRSAYRNIVKARQPLMQAAVDAMLDPNVEVLEVEMTDGSKVTVTGEEAKKLKAEGKVLSEDPLWSGGGLASFNSARMRRLGWVSHVVDDMTALASALNITGRLQAVRVQPDQWHAARLEIDDELTAQRVNQIMRSIGQRKSKSPLNLLVFQVSDVKADFAEALRLAQYITELEQDGVTTVAVLEQSNASASLLVAFACDQVVCLPTVNIGSPERKPGLARSLTDGTLMSLIALEQSTGRPASLMLATMDPESTVKLYVHQATGKQLPLAPWQLERQEQPEQWVANETLTSDGQIAKPVALRYGLIDSEAADYETAIRDLGLETDPDKVEEPWLETTIQGILAREWLPRLLVTVGFFALMIEMGSPGLGAGGFVAALCFLGFFWIEGLNGNVEWLEILLFVSGMIALAIELFILPGFGLFGIGGLLMILASIVLAGQTFVFPSNSEQLTVIANNLFWVAVCALMVVIGAVSMGRR